VSEAGDHRVESRRRWGAAAAGWKQNLDVLARLTMPVTSAMIDALEPQPGMVLLELAAGMGEVGFMAAELIQPGGELITSDFAPEMLSGAQERAQELGVPNVRFKQIDAHSIDLDAASIDGVLCRWGYMLMTDRVAALRETRRVLKPDGRAVFAVWASPDDNPWMSLLRRQLQERDVLEPDVPDDPGPFSLADPDDIRRLLDEAGFDDEVTLEAVDLAYPYPDIDTYIDISRQMGTLVRQGLESLDESEQQRVIRALAEGFEPYRQEAGGFLVPGRSWVVTATA
jgi:SAM-dependent methyltransferase